MSSAREESDRIIGSLNQPVVAKKNNSDKQLEEELRQWLAEKLPAHKDYILSPIKIFNKSCDLE
jgi:hypothetical protein